MFDEGKSSEIETTDDVAPAVADWEKNFERAVTAALYAAAIRYATRRAEQVAAVGGRVDDGYVRDLVQGVIVDTLTGKIVWDRERCPLEQHVIAAIKSRSRHDRERVPDQREVPFDIHDRADEGVTLHAEVEKALDAQRVDTDSRDRAAARIAALRSLAVAAHDNDVLLLLEQMELGALTREEVVEATGLSPKRYRNARNRLLAYGEQLVDQPALAD